MDPWFLTQKSKFKIQNFNKNCLRIRRECCIFAMYSRGSIARIIYHAAQDNLSRETTSMRPRIDVSIYTARIAYLWHLGKIILLLR